MTCKKYFSFGILSLLCFAGMPFRTVAQQTGRIKPPKHTIDSILASENLISLSTAKTTFYSKGFYIRAKTLQKLFYDCTNYYENIFSDKKFSVHLYMLNRSDWEKLPLKFPYGLPFYDPDYNILVIAAEKDALAKLSGLKDIPATPDSVLTDFDYQPLHELGHYFFFTLNNINEEKWFNEFLATYFLICYINDKGLAPGLKNELKANYSVDHRSLDDFEKLYVNVGPANYHWYQCNFAQLGFKLYPQFKTSLIKTVIDNYRSTGKNLDGISLLETMAPETTNEWLKEMK